MILHTTYIYPVAGTAALTGTEEIRKPSRETYIGLNCLLTSPRVRTDRLGQYRADYNIAAGYLQVNCSGWRGVGGGGVRWGVCGYVGPGL